MATSNFATCYRGYRVTNGRKKLLGCKTVTLDCLFLDNHSENMRLLGVMIAKLHAAFGTNSVLCIPTAVVHVGPVPLKAGLCKSMR